MKILLSEICLCRPNKIVLLTMRIDKFLPKTGILNAKSHLKYIYQPMIKPLVLEIADIGFNLSIFYLLTWGFVKKWLPAYTLVYKVVQKYILYFTVYYLINYKY